MSSHCETADHFVGAACEEKNKTNVAGNMGGGSNKVLYSEYSFAFFSIIILVFVKKSN
jgi:hypothetical protein